MAVALAVLGVAFAAFCVWLTVRGINRREKWAKRTGAALVAVLVAYPLSIGPAFWFRLSGLMPDWMKPAMWAVYVPLTFVAQLIPPLGKMLAWYIELWIG